MPLDPRVQSSIVTDGTTASATPAINLPATVNAGHTLFVVFRVAVAGAIGWPAGWTELFDASPDAADDQMAAAWKSADGTEGGTQISLTCTSGKFAAIAYAIADVANPSMRPPELSTVATGTSAGQPNATTCTPTGGSKQYLWLTFFGCEGEQTGITTYPTGYSSGQLYANSGTAGAVTTNVRVAGAAKTATAASDDAGEWTVGGVMDDWTAYTIAFHPGILLEEAVRLTDTVTPSMGLADLNLLESVRLTDIVTASITPLSPNALSEDLKISDAVTPARDLEQAVTSEGVRLQDGPALSAMGLSVVVTEILGIDDNQNSPYQETLRLTDTVTAAIAAGNALSVTVTSEAVKVADDVQAITDLVVSASESVRVQDAATTTLDPLGTGIANESVRVSDSVQAAAQLAAAIAPDEAVRVQDAAPVGRLDPIEGAIGESVRVADTDLSVSLVDAGGMTASLSELLRVQDQASGTLDPLATDVAEAVRVQDTVTAARGLTAEIAESVRVQDQVTAARGLTAAIAPDEAVRVQDQVTASRDLTASLSESVTVQDGPVLGSPDMVASLLESVRVQDAPSLTLNPIEASIAEAVRVEDTLNGGTGPAALVVETVRVQDGPVTAQLSNLRASADETIRVSDAPAGTLDPLRASDTESVRVSDAVTAILGDVSLAASESVRVSDSVQAALVHHVAVDETIRIADTVTARLSHLDATASESVRVADSVTALRFVPPVISDTVTVDVVIHRVVTVDCAVSRRRTVDVER